MIWFWVFLFLGSSPVWADEIQDLPDFEIVVSETFNPLSEGGETPSQITINPQETSHRFLSTSELVSQQAGVHLTRYGGLDEATAVSIRGASSDEVSVWLDGVPLTSANGSGPSWEMIPLEDLSSITLYKGAQPQLTGGGSSGGVIHLQTQDHHEESLRVSLSGGSYQTVRAQTFGSWKVGRSFFILGNSFLRSQGNFTFKDDNATPLNTDDDRWVKRQNNQSLRNHSFFKWHYDFDENTRLQWSAHWSMRDAGVPGGSSNQSQKASLTQSEGLFSLLVQEDHFFSDKLAFESSTYGRLKKSQYSDLLGEIGLGGAQDNDDDTSLFGQKFTWHYNPKGSQVFSLFTQFQTERFRPENFLVQPAQGGTSVRKQLNAGFTHQAQWWKGRLISSASVWSENVYNQLNNEDPSSLTPGTFKNERAHHVWGGVGQLSVPVLPGVLLKGQIERSVRFPYFSELFGDQGGVLGNPTLRPQKTWQWDVGLGLRKNFSFSQSQHPFILRTNGGITFFDRHAQDLIQFQQMAGLARAENVGQSRIYGLESDVRLDVNSYAALWGNYTFQQAKDQGRNQGRFLPGRPQHEIHAGVDLYYKKWRPYLTLDWMDQISLDPLNTRVIQDRLILNTGLAFKPRAHWTLSFEAKNVTGNQIVDVLGFPLPGRSFFGRVSWEKGKKQGVSPEGAENGFSP